MILFSDEYKTIGKLSTGTFRDKGSRFLAFAVPVAAEAEVKSELESLRKKYYDATHHCYAYILGPDKSAWRANDDGEPSGTAGKPIYNTLLSSDLTNILLVVVRYYGGTKLGVPGLIHAYKSAAREALSNAEIITCTLKEIYTVHYPYELTNELMRILKDMQSELLESSYHEQCELTCAVRRSNGMNFRERISKLNGITLNFKSLQ